MSLTEPSANQADVAEQSQRLRRTEIRATLLRHKGSIARIAEQLHVTDVTVSMVLRGRTTSRRIYEAAEAMARQLLEQEKSNVPS